MNQDSYDAFWYFIDTRHQIYLNKEAGEPWPWSNDPVLNEWKFCNVFRQNDKQSKWLIENVIKPHSSENDDASMLLFNLFAFRAFNLHETFNALSWHKNWIDNWDEQDAKTILWNLTVNQKYKLTSGAYMIRGREGMPKYESIVMTLDEIWNKKEELLNNFYRYDLWGRKTISMHSVYESIMWQGFWGWGPFTAYQIVLDLTYTTILNNPSDLNNWCIFGPGAERGIREIWPDLKKKDMLGAAKQLREDSPKHLGSHVPTMNLQDIEFSLCESFKYNRIRNGGKGKERYIK